MMFDMFPMKSHLNNNNKAKESSELISLISDLSSYENHHHHSNKRESTETNEITEETNKIQENDSTETNQQQICRICYSNGDLQSLISPCQCSGTMGILHRNCLERWLEISNTTKCEICQYEYEVIRYPRSLIYFLTNPLRPSDIRYLINDLILFIFLTTIISWLFVVSIGKVRLTKTMIDSFSLLVLPSIVLSIYFVWCWVSFRYHLYVMKEWRSANQLIRVQVMKKTDSDQRRSRSTLDEPAENLLTEIRVVK